MQCDIDAWACNEHWVATVHSTQCSLLSLKGKLTACCIDLLEYGTLKVRPKELMSQYQWWRRPKSTICILFFLFPRDRGEGTKTGDAICTRLCFVIRKPFIPFNMDQLCCIQCLELTHHISEGIRNELNLLVLDDSHGLTSCLLVQLGSAQDPF